MGKVGSELYGAVDRIPGLCYVATKFDHVFFLPLLPAGTYIVWEGSEHEEGFQGKRVALSWKSMLIGYYRGWVGALAVFLFAFQGMTTPMILGVDEHPATVIIFLVGLVVGITATLFVVSSRLRAWMIVELLMHGWSAAAWFIASAAAKPSEYLPLIACANFALLAYSVTRLFDRASRARALQLGQELGLDPDTVEEALAGRVKSATRYAATPRGGVPG
jgi:hypothetical protein